MKVIDAYSRAEALKQGRLVDVTEDAIAFGIHHPTAISDGVCRWIARRDDPDLKIGVRRFQALLSSVVSLDLIQAGLAEPGQGQPFGIAWQLDVGLLELASFKVVCATSNEGETEVTILLDEDVIAPLH